jgi:thymidylate synthase
MKAYIDIAKNILENGEWKGNRTGIRTKTTFCEIFRHKMSDGFPLLTTKKMGLRNIAVELEFFIKGLTDKQWLKKRGCHIWDEWANPLKVKKRYDDIEYFKPMPGLASASTDIKELQKEETDLGPVYGYQWRKFDQHYGPINCYPEDFSIYSNGVGIGTDQFQTIVETLKKNPDDRRMVCSAWNPNQIDLMALPPCHYAWTLVHINGKLNLCWKQR